MRNAHLLSSTVMRMVVGAGLLTGGAVVLAGCFDTTSSGSAAARPAATQVAAAGNPCAAKKPGNSCNPCNPCAAKKGCNPCAAKKGCNPCAAKPACNPCNPCAGAQVAVSDKCRVPRLVTAAVNPCAARKGCNPCAAKKACNPCAAKRACNPCAAKSPCNPCGAANPCNPCNPCAAAETPEITATEANTVYDCLLPEMRAGYRKSGLEVAVKYAGWDSFNARPYPSATHGGRLVNNYANPIAAASYGKFEDVGEVAVGGLLAKDSFTVTQNGRSGSGPLFLMEKMPAGFNQESDDWRYTMIMADGTVFGTTNGKASENVQFCIGCHVVVKDEQDSLMLIPDEYRDK